MKSFDVIGKIFADDHPCPYEAIEAVNADLGGDYRIVSYYENGQGNTTEFYLVEESDDDE